MKLPVSVCRNHKNIKRLLVLASQHCKPTSSSMPPGRNEVCQVTDSGGGGSQEAPPMASVLLRVLKPSVCSPAAVFKDWNWVTPWKFYFGPFRTCTFLRVTPWHNLCYFWLLADRPLAFGDPLLRLAEYTLAGCTLNFTSPNVTFSYSCLPVL